MHFAQATTVWNNFSAYLYSTRLQQITLQNQVECRFLRDVQIHNNFACNTASRNNFDVVGQYAYKRVQVHIIFGSDG